MCGICGLIDRAGVGSELVVRMRDAMTHRGPDDAGLFIDATGTVALGHRRLSIIDLSERGRQPLSNEDGTLRAVVNGEFYGYGRQRGELLDRGHRLASDSDSEVLVHLYEDEGPECLGSLRGMFGVALWDDLRRRLLLGRDRVGKKPLYYAHAPGRFAFGSELKALAPLEWVDDEIDPNALDAYLALGYVPGTLSISRGVRRLGPGERLLYDADSDVVRVERYWSLPEAADVQIAEDEAVERLGALIQDAVGLRMVSDVPVGVFLSGGVDSSLVAAYAARATSRPLRTFTIGFEESTHNELPFARLVAAHLGSDHHEIMVSVNMLDVVDALPDLYDEPFADSSAVPTYYVSKATRESVAVALGGDGGDELFAGYNWYDWVLKTQRLRRRLGVFAPIAGIAPSVLPAGARGRHFLWASSLGLPEAMADRTFIFSAGEREALVRAELTGKAERGGPESYLAARLDGRSDTLDAMQRYDFSRYLPDDILVKVDRASMAVSLEVRAPLLDQELCSFAFSLPSFVRTAGGVKKGLLKRLARLVLPAELPLERKQGFSLPLSAWLRGGFGDTLLERVRGSSRLAAIIDPAFATSLLAAHRGGRRDNTARLWSLLVLATWLEARR